MTDTDTATSTKLKVNAESGPVRSMTRGDATFTFYPPLRYTLAVIALTGAVVAAIVAMCVAGLA